MNIDTFSNETLMVSACGNMVEKYTCIKMLETVVEESVEIITSIAHASCSGLFDQFLCL